MTTATTTTGRFPGIDADSIARDARVYDEGHGAGKAEGFAQVLAALAAGEAPERICTECRRTHPRVDEELQRRGVAAHPDGRLELRQPPLAPRPVPEDDEPAPPLVQPNDHDCETGQLVIGERPLTPDGIARIRAEVEHMRPAAAGARAR